jgi:hypothetical protein
MFRNPTVISDRMVNGARVLKIIGASGTSYWDLEDSNGTLIASAPNTIGGFIAFETDYSGTGTVFPVTLKGTVYRNGIALGISS